MAVILLAPSRGRAPGKAPSLGTDEAIVAQSVFAGSPPAPPAQQGLDLSQHGEEGYIYI
jgi:hypothetical protein